MAKKGSKYDGGTVKAGVRTASKSNPKGMKRAPAGKDKKCTTQMY